VQRHTFGAAAMTDLDRVVYLADALEPGRQTRSADELRGHVSHITLGELYERAYAASLEHLVRRRRRIHPATVEAWNSIVEERT
jgi:HD superfamily phosphohydrolase YqeK